MPDDFFSSATQSQRGTNEALILHAMVILCLIENCLFSNKCFNHGLLFSGCLEGKAQPRRSRTRVEEEGEERGRKQVSGKGQIAVVQANTVLGQGLCIEGDSSFHSLLDFSNALVKLFLFCFIGNEPKRCCERHAGTRSRTKSTSWPCKPRVTEQSLRGS